MQQIPHEYCDIPRYAFRGLPANFNPENLRLFVKGFRWMRRIEAHETAYGVYRPCGPSQLPKGDEEGAPPPGVESLTWDNWRIGEQPFEVGLGDSNSWNCSELRGSE